MAFSRGNLFWYCAGIATVVVVELLVQALNGAKPPASVVAESPVEGPVEGPVENPASPAQISPADNTSAPSGKQGAGPMDEVLSRLEARIAAQGGSDSDWELLAQTYEFVGRTADAKLARAHQLPATASKNANQGATITAATAAASVSGNIELAGTLRSRIPDGLTLFIVAKSVDSPGPPVAIIRTTTGHWPLAFTLDDSNAMMPGRNLSSAQHVTIEARVSRSGMAAPQPGDYQSAVATIDPHDPKSVRIIIDHVIG
jgi:hypothetical protein